MLKSELKFYIIYSIQWNINIDISFGIYTTIVSYISNINQFYICQKSKLKKVENININEIAQNPDEAFIHDLLPGCCKVQINKIGKVLNNLQTHLK